MKKLAGVVRDRTSSLALIVGVQDPIRLSDHSEPLPDISILRPRRIFYAEEHPRPKDILVLLEVADASVMYGRNTKLPLYARHGIGEVWLVDLVKNVVDVLSSPAPPGTQARSGSSAERRPAPRCCPAWPFRWTRFSSADGGDSSHFAEQIDRNMIGSKLIIRQI